MHPNIAKLRESVTITIMKCWVLIITALFLWMPSIAFGCSPSGPISFNSGISGSDVIFAGIVKEEIPTVSVRGYHPDRKLRVQTVKTYKGYVDEEVVVTKNMGCDQANWFPETNKIYIFLAHGYGDELEITDAFLQFDQMALVKYLEKGGLNSILARPCKFRPFGIPEVDHPTYPANPQYLTVRCHSMPRDIEDHFRFIPPRSPAQ